MKFNTDPKVMFAGYLRNADEEYYDMTTAEGRALHDVDLKCWTMMYDAACGIWSLRGVAYNGDECARQIMFRLNGIMKLRKAIYLPRAGLSGNYPFRTRVSPIVLDIIEE